MLQCKGLSNKFMWHLFCASATGAPSSELHHEKELEKERKFQEKYGIREDDHQRAYAVKRYEEDHDVKF